MDELKKKVRELKEENMQLKEHMKNAKVRAEIGEELRISYQRRMETE